METGRCGNSRVEQAKSRLCQRCDANSVDDVEHMIFDYCVAMDVERQKHQSLFARGRVALVDFLSRTQQNWLLLCTIVASKACKE